MIHPMCIVTGGLLGAALRSLSMAVSGLLGQALKPNADFVGGFRSRLRRVSLPPSVSVGSSSASAFFHALQTCHADAAGSSQAHGTLHLALYPSAHLSSQGISHALSASRRLVRSGSTAQGVSRSTATTLTYDDQDDAMVLALFACAVKQKKVRP